VHVQDLFDLTGRVAIVTGGTRGIGLAIAQGFVDAGAKVAVASRKADACRDVAASLGDSAIGVPTHLGDLTALHDLVAATVERFGRLDVVVNNAATAVSQPVGEFTPDAWEKVYDVNLRGPVFLIQEALPYLDKSPCASVINVISAGAFLFSLPTAMYSGAKAGLMSLTRSLAAGYAPRGIRVNALAPGSVDTDMVRNTGPEAMERMGNASIMKRIADPWEMVGPAVFLASDASSFMTGQVLLVDGGLVPHGGRPSGPAEPVPSGPAEPVPSGPRAPRRNPDTLPSVRGTASRTPPSPSAWRRALRRRGPPASTARPGSTSRPSPPTTRGGRATAWRWG
jgi:NAD(P)-dependent dehydrogenase (short-subunit alcohol dehydrogenase family)